MCLTQNWLTIFKDLSTISTEEGKEGRKADKGNGCEKVRNAAVSPGCALGKLLLTRNFFLPSSSVPLPQLRPSKGKIFRGLIAERN